jgi:HSP20 family molecular chaperone IbpA
MVLPSLAEEIDRLFDELVSRRWGGSLRQLTAAEVRTVDDGWVIELPVEGLEAADLEVQVEGRQLTVTGQRMRRHERRSKSQLVARSESQLSLRRTFTLPANVEAGEIAAHLDGSTLTIHIRKPQPWRTSVQTAKSRPR